MTFEKALEAMKQGKKITCKGSEFYYFMSRENEIRCINFVIGYETTVKFFCSDILSDKWETYEEPEQEKPEMTAGHAIEVLKSIRQVTSKSVIPDVDETIDFAIESIENKGKAEPEKKCECKYLDKLEEVYKFISFLYTDCEFTPNLCEKVTNCYEDLKDFLYYQRKNARG